MITRVCMVGVLALAFLTGCGILFPEEVNYFDGATVEVSPYGDVVALVNPKKFPKFLSGYEERRIHLTPTLRPYFSEFAFASDAESGDAVQPDGVVFVVHLNGDFVGMIQRFLDRGLDYFDHSDPSLWSSTVDEIYREREGSWPSNRASTVQLRQDPGVGTVFGLPRNPPGPDSLLGYVMLPTNDLVGDRLLHEVTHFFGLHFDGPPVLRNMLESYGSHMGFASGGGLLCGWYELVEVDELTYQARVAPYGRGVAKRQYADLELYAMGLLDADAVAPIQVALNPQVIEDDLNGLTFRVDGLAEVTIEEIVAANGVRPPRTQPLRLTLVVLSDRTLTARDWDYYHACTQFMSSDDPDLTFRDFFSEDQFPAHTSYWNWLLDPGETLRNYSQATGGRGSLEVLKVE